MKSTKTMILSGISALLLLTSCSNEDSVPSEASTDIKAEETTTAESEDISDNVTETGTSETTIGNVNDVQAEAVQTISFDRFSIQIPSDFEGNTDETAIRGIYSTPNHYRKKMPDGESVVFSWGFEAMYPADTGRFDETPAEIAERHQKMYFVSENEEQEYVRQHPFYLNPSESKDVYVKDCPFVYQTGTMKRENEDKLYYYEAYFGNIPYKNSAFDISHAPAFWISFANDQSEEAKEYVRTITEQAAASFSYQ